MQEVSCAVWHAAKRDSYFTASWDTTIKLFSVANPMQSVATLQGHMKEVYEVSTTARSPFSILSCSGDGTWKLWDLRTPQAPVLSQFAHQNQIVLSVDFNKQDPNLFASGGVDRTVRIWDARRPNQPLASLPGHDQACRRVRFSPHSRTLLASSGYDMRVCVWDLNSPQRPMVGRYQQHREFVVGLEWSPAVPNALATTSFDGTAFFLTVGQAPVPSPPVPLPPAIPPPRVAMPRSKVLPGLPSPGMPFGGPMPMPGSPPRSPR
ncbi:peroxin-7 [Strigomonas culicis]|nr:peroxin-7 [Strigomonas culicis]|eukprot:EPY18719.1 peroxin-7 [Strigomonas culicis]